MVNALSDYDAAIENLDTLADDLSYLPSLRPLSNDCLNQFNRLTTRLENPAFDFILSKTPPSAWLDEQTRFCIWCTNSGALLDKQDRKSLDWKLSDKDYRFGGSRTKALLHTRLGAALKCLSRALRKANAAMDKFDTIGNNVPKQGIFGKFVAGQKEKYNRGTMRVSFWSVS